MMEDYLKDMVNTSFEMNMIGNMWVYHLLWLMYSWALTSFVGKQSIFYGILVKEKLQKSMDRYTCCLYITEIVLKLEPKTFHSF